MLTIFWYRDFSVLVDMAGVLVRMTRSHAWERRQQIVQHWHLGFSVGFLLLLLS